MFSRKPIKEIDHQSRIEFSSLIRNGKIDELLAKLNYDPQTKALSKKTKSYLDTILDPKTGYTPLHDMAITPFYNSVFALESEDNESKSQDAAPYQKAKLLLSLLRQVVPALTLEETTGQNAFIKALASKHRYTAQALFGHEGQAACMVVDKQKRTALHYATEAAFYEIIQLIMRTPNSRELLFVLDKEKMTPLALALDCYRKQRTILNMSIVHQLYFEQEGTERTRGVEMEVRMAGDTWFSRPFWKYTLDLCFERDSNKKIIRTDMQIIKFIDEAINNKSAGALIVQGSHVNLSLILKYYFTGIVESSLFRQAFQDLPNQQAMLTQNLTHNNRTLETIPELAKHLKTIHKGYLYCIEGPALQPNLELLKTLPKDAELWFYCPNKPEEKHPENAIVALGKLYRVTRATRKHIDPFVEIKFNELDENQKASFNQLAKNMLVVPTKGREASAEEIDLMVCLAPFSKAKVRPMATMKLSGMGFHSNPTPTSTAHDTSMSSSSSMPGQTP